MNIGFVGYSARKFDVEKAKEIITEIFTNNVKPGDVIVSSGTDVGIIKLVYEEAARNGLRTVGVICNEGKNDKLHRDTQIIVRGQNWGDESEYFISIIDKLYRIGGGAQSLREVQMAKAKGIPVIEYELSAFNPNK